MGNATIRQSAYDFLFDFNRNYLSIAGQINANMQHNRANGDTSTKIGVITP